MKIMKNEKRIFRHFDGTDVICEIKRRGGKDRVIATYANGVKQSFGYCDKVCFTPWGFVEVYEDSFYPQDMIENFNWFSEFNGCSIFEENGHFGLQRNGEVVFPAVLNQIEHVGERLFLRRGKAYSLLEECGSSTVFSRFDDNDSFFIENGRMGWMRNGEVLIPAMYENIDKWYNYDVFRCSTSREHIFVNSAGEEILVDESQDWDSVGDGFSGNDTFMRVQLATESDDDAFGYGEGFVKGEVVSTSSLNSLMTEGGEQIKCTEKDLHILNSDYTWDYASFKVSAKGDRAVTDCLEQISSLPVFNSTWHYLLKISTNQGSSLSANDLREIRYKFEDEDSHILSLRISAGTDNLLKDGEVSMILTRFYQEGSFPAPCLFHLTDVLRDSTLEEILAETENLKDEIRNELEPEEAKKEIERMFYGVIEDISHHCKRPWKESLRVMEYFKDIDPLWRTRLGKVFCGWIFTSPFSFTVKDAKFEMRKVKWMLDNGVIINKIYDGDTFLGHVENRLQEENNPDADVIHFSDKKLKMVEELQELLISYGAKTKAQIRAEESFECNYDSEMRKLLDYCHQEGRIHD